MLLDFLKMKCIALKLYDMNFKYTMSSVFSKLNKDSTPLLKNISQMAETETLFVNLKTE